MSEGIKFDDGKLPMQLLAPDSIRGLARVLQYGAGKYSQRNWEMGMEWGRVFGACLRHLWSWWAKEDIDPETGLSHLDHAAACIHFLSAYEKRSVGTDDRP